MVNGWARTSQSKGGRSIAYKIPKLTVNRVLTVNRQAAAGWLCHPVPDDEVNQGLSETLAGRRNRH
jgi:hypothetical protein